VRGNDWPGAGESHTGDPKSGNFDGVTVACTVRVVSLMLRRHAAAIKLRGTRGNRVTTIGLAGAGPIIVGAIKDLTGTFNGGLAAVGILLGIGVGLMLPG
jgi:hypothetical protein